MKMFNFRKFLEMASFTLPKSIEINNQEVEAIDMQFEKFPKTLDKNGRVMNQGSKFIAEIPNSNYYVAYDGKGKSFITKNYKQYLDDGYEIINKNWYKKAHLI